MPGWALVTVRLQKGLKDIVEIEVCQTVAGVLAEPVLTLASLASDNQNASEIACGCKKLDPGAFAFERFGFAGIEACDVAYGGCLVAAGASHHNHCSSEDNQTCCLGSLAYPGVFGSSSYHSFVDLHIVAVAAVVVKVSERLEVDGVAGTPFVAVYRRLRSAFEDNVSLCHWWGSYSRRPCFAAGHSDDDPYSHTSSPGQR